MIARKIQKMSRFKSVRRDWLRGADLVGMILLVEVSMTSLGTTAWAAGGAGGYQENGLTPGGAGGISGPEPRIPSLERFRTDGGRSEEDDRLVSGGGGGGAGGSEGGKSGYDGSRNYPNFGGMGGTVDDKNGAAGEPGYGLGNRPLRVKGRRDNANSGGGGGGGYNGNGAGAAALTNSAPLAGGRGGAGGDGSEGDRYAEGLHEPGAGGGGGAGGYGAFVTGDGTSSNNSTISGGDGGAGGRSVGGIKGGVGAGGGGDGGIGIAFTAPGATFDNTGSVSGGNGGAAGLGYDGAANGGAGYGGVGISGDRLSIDNAGGTITGGMSGNGVQAYAIHFTGGANSVGVGGTINGGIHVTGGGSLMPAAHGSVVGTPLAINGPMTFAPGTEYIVRLNPRQNDSIVATGAATIAGAKVAVLGAYGGYSAGTRTILTASAVGGTFTGVVTNLAFLKPTLSYDPTHVFLTISAGGTKYIYGSTSLRRTIVTKNPVTGVLTFVPNYRTAAATLDQFAIAGALTRVGVKDGGTGKVLKAVNQLTVPQADADFNDMTGEGITAAQNVAYRASALFDSAIFDQTTFYGAGGTGNSITLTTPTPSGMLAYAPIHELADLSSVTHQPVTPAAPDRSWRAWASGFGGVEDIHGSGIIGSASQDSTIYGGVLGVDDQLTPNYLVGVALGGSDGEFSVADRATFGSTTGGHIAVYDLATFGGFYGASSNSFSYFTNKTTRLVSGFGGLGGETEQGTFDSHEFRSRLEFGRHFEGYGGTMTPFVALELAELRSNGFGETAQSGPGLLALNVSGQSSASAPSSVGARFQRVTALGNGLVLTPTLEVAYVHEFAPQRTQFGTLASLPGSTFLVDGASPSSNAATVKAGGEIALGANSSLFANFDGEFSGTSQYYGGKGGFKFVW